MFHTGGTMSYVARTAFLVAGLLAAAVRPVDAGEAVDHAEVQAMDTILERLSAANELMVPGKEGAYYTACRGVERLCLAFIKRYPDRASTPDAKDVLTLVRGEIARVRPIVGARLSTGEAVAALRDFVKEVEGRPRRVLDRAGLEGLREIGRPALRSPQAIRLLVRLWELLSQPAEDVGEDGVLVMGAPNIVARLKPGGGESSELMKLYLVLVSGRPDYRWPAPFLSQLIGRARECLGQPEVLAFLDACAVQRDAGADGVKRDAANRTFLHVVAAAYLQVGAVPRSLALYDRLLVDFPDGFPKKQEGVDLMLRLASLHLAQDPVGVEKALRVSELGAKAFGKLQRVHWEPTLSEVGRQMESVGGPDAAIAFWTAVFEHVPHGAEEMLAARQLVRFYRAKRQMDPARAVVQELVARSRTYPFKLPEIAKLGEAIGDHDRAVEAYRLYLKRFPTGQPASQARLGLARLLAKTGEYEAAEEAYRTVHSEHPDLLPARDLDLRLAELRRKAQSGKRSKGVGGRP